LTNREDKQVHTTTIKMISKKSCRVTLADGSAWTIGQSARKWKQGDRIMVASRRGDDTQVLRSHLLLNLDRSGGNAPQTRL